MIGINMGGSINEIIHSLVISHFALIYVPLKVRKYTSSNMHTPRELQKLD